MNAYDKITHRLIEMLEQGVVPWRRTWIGGASNRPTNFVTKRCYRGFNVLVLTATALVEGYQTNEWLTQRQVDRLGGRLKPKQGSSLIVYYTWFEPKSTIQHPEPKPRSMFRYYEVYNVAQVDGLPVDNSIKLELAQPIEECELVIASMPQRPVIKRGLPSYNYELDEVQVPERGQFEMASSYYSALFHELVHSTGHKIRLDRKFSRETKFGTDSYSEEELIAEIGACFLCGMTGIEAGTIQNSASYIKYWLGRLRANPSWVVRSAGKAQKAVDFILGDKGGNQS